MKRIVAAALVLALMLGLAAGMTTAAGEVVTKYVKTGNRGVLNVRSSPHAPANNKIGELKYGEAVGVDHVEGEWAQIVWGSQDAWVQARYLVDTKPAGQPRDQDKPTDSQGKVLTDSALGSQTVEGLNSQFSGMNYVTPYKVAVIADVKSGTARIRWAPSKYSKLVEYVRDGTLLTVIAEGRNWKFIYDEAAKVYGFIASKYTTIAK